MADAGAGTSTGTGTGTTDAGNGSGKDWLPQEYRGEAMFQNFKDVGDLAKSYKSGSERWGAPHEILRIPKDDAGWDNFYKQIGRPDKADAYELKAEGITLNPKLMESAKNAFHKAGLTPKQAALIFAEQTTTEKALMAELATERKAQGDATVTAMKAKWGDKYDAEMAASKQMFNRLLTPGLKKAMADSGLDSHPDMVELFNKLSKTIKMGEDGMLSGGGGDFTSRTVESVKAERVKLGEELQKMKDPLNPLYKEKTAQFQKLLMEEGELKLGTGT